MVNFKPWKGGRRESVFVVAALLLLSPSILFHWSTKTVETTAQIHGRTLKKNRVEITRIFAEICALAYLFVWKHQKDTNVSRRKSSSTRMTKYGWTLSHSRLPSPPSPSLLLFATLVPNRLSLSSSKAAKPEKRDPSSTLSRKATAILQCTTDRRAPTYLSVQQKKCPERRLSKQKTYTEKGILFWNCLLFKKTCRKLIETFGKVN